MILDSTERLELGEGFSGVTESRLPTEKWPKDDRWPTVWRGGGTLVLPYGDTIRIRFLPYAGPD